MRVRALLSRRGAGAGRVPALASRLRALRTARHLRAQVDADLRRWLLAELWRTDQRAIAEAGVALSRFDASDWIGGVDVPHAVVVTELDTAVLPARQRRLAEMLPAPTVHPCRSDHADCVRRPNHFVPALLEALDAVSG